jgi:YebC/PmpR family DNA-binding regulatory protein
MAGHSHWANIAHKKGRIDAKRGKLFGKLSRAIIVAARNGGGDPDMNLALRYAIDKAKKNSMPKDNIERAVQKGCGESDGEDFQELSYEGYGPAGVAIICDALTENRNRTAGEVRKTFEVYGGNLGNSGCVAYLFDLKGYITVPAGETDEETLFELAVEAGAEDVREAGDSFEVITPVDQFQQVADALAAKEIETDVSEVTRLPQTNVELDEGDARKVIKLLEALEDNEDVQSVTTNAEFPDSVMADA